MLYQQQKTAAIFVLHFFLLNNVCTYSMQYITPVPHRREEAVFVYYFVFLSEES